MHYNFNMKVFHSIMPLRARARVNVCVNICLPHINYNWLFSTSNMCRIVRWAPGAPSKCPSKKSRQSSVTRFASPLILTQNVMLTEQMSPLSHGHWLVHIFSMLVCLYIIWQPASMVHFNGNYFHMWEQHTCIYPVRVLVYLSRLHTGSCH